MFASSPPAAEAQLARNRGAPGSPGAVVSVGLLLLLAVTAVAAGSTPRAGTEAGATTPGPAALDVPLGGTELYGYLPYWQMTASMADYVAGVPLTTLALFSVSARRDGSLDPTLTGYRRITASIGQRLVAEAHARGRRVELVFSSFGFEKNARLFGRPTLEADREAANRAPREAASPPPRFARTVAELLALVRALDLDGINVDVESIDGQAFEGYTTFLAQLRSGLADLGPGIANTGRRTLSVATMASHSGAALARAAVAAGVDRVFLMGYEYHWSGSDPGGSAPIDRIDGGRSLRWSIAQYLGLGVPAERILLGLPLYGMGWPVAAPERSAPRTGKGAPWIPANHADVLTSPTFQPRFDRPEIAEYFTQPIPGPASSPPAVSPLPGSPLPGATPGPDPTPTSWRAIFYDSPRTLRPKLALARTSQFAGAGFWAIGYERGLTGYLELMSDFRAGNVVPDEVLLGELDRLTDR